MTITRTATVHVADEAPGVVLEAAAPYAARFGTRFDRYVCFDRELLDELHADPDPDAEGVLVASRTDPSVLDEMTVLETVANLPESTAADRRAYRDALVRIYGKLPRSAGAEAAAATTLVVAPEREGRQLAEVLDALPPDRSITPSAKRVPLDTGLVVGISDAEPPLRTDTGLLVDGVVASGVTIMAFLGVLGPHLSRLTIVTAHSTAAGACAVVRYARRVGVDVELVVGHVSGTLTSSFYAATAPGADRLVLGDVGDTLAGL